MWHKRGKGASFRVGLSNLFFRMTMVNSTDGKMHELAAMVSKACTVGAAQAPRMDSAGCQ